MVPVGKKAVDLLFGNPYFLGKAVAQSINRVLQGHRKKQVGGDVRPSGLVANLESVGRPEAEYYP